MPSDAGAAILGSIRQRETSVIARSGITSLRPIPREVTCGITDERIDAVPERVAGVQDVRFGEHDRDVTACRDMLVAVRDRVADLKRQGRSSEDTVAAKPTADFDAKWGQFVIDAGFFTRLVYEGV
jgi:hypothetical protein